MITIILPYGLCLVAFGLLLYPIISFHSDAKSLRKYPAPSVAAYTSLWRIWYNVKQKHYLAVHEAHKQLGTHVRIAPNHISILHPDAPNQVYGHGANMMKEGWYDAGAGAHRNLADARDKLEHQSKRKMLAHVFAAKTVIEFQPLLVETLISLREQLDKCISSENMIDMRLYLNFLTIDLFGKLLYGVQLDCLSRGDDLLDAEDASGRIYKVPFIQSLLDATVINTFLAFNPSLLPVTRSIAQVHPYKKAGTDWENIIYHNTKKRLSQEGGEDLFQRLLKDNKGNDLNLVLGEMVAECSVMMNAGTETTTVAMTNTIFLLYTHPRVLEKLREELDSSIPEVGIPKYEDVARLPYLRACIEESLRVRPASSFGLPRVVPKGGREVAGQMIPEGVTVSVPTYSLLRDESVFEKADEYIPERWLTEDSETKRQMMNSHLPFSTGPRACIGRNIAYFEQIVVIATMVKFYNFQVPEGFELETQERFNSNAGNFVVGVTARSCS